jgi:hypothetical protein
MMVTVHLLTGILHRREILLSSEAYYNDDISSPFHRIYRAALSIIKEYNASLYEIILPVAVEERDSAALSSLSEHTLTHSRNDILDNFYRIILFALKPHVVCDDFPPTLPALIMWGFTLFSRALKDQIEALVCLKAFLCSPLEEKARNFIWMGLWGYVNDLLT